MWESWREWPFDSECVLNIVYVCLISYPKNDSLCSIVFWYFVLVFLSLCVFDALWFPGSNVSSIYSTNVLILFKEWLLLRQTNIFISFRTQKPKTNTNRRTKGFTAIHRTPTQPAADVFSWFHSFSIYARSQPRPVNLGSVPHKSENVLMQFPAIANVMNPMASSSSKRQWTFPYRCVLASLLRGKSALENMLRQTLKAWWTKGITFVMVCVR